MKSKKQTSKGLRGQKPITSMAQAEAFLMGLVNYEVKPPPATVDEEGWHLKAFRKFLRRLDDPQKAAPIIHIAGTKGKGSTARILSALLAAHGWKRVGAFTSPHLESFRERIAIDGEMISEKDFIESLEAVRHFLPQGPSEGFRTTFETLTAMAFERFRRSGSEAVVLETGLGGRLDCTNVAPSRVALITTIGFDHQRVLGSTIAAIASEKVGIIKRGTARALVAPQPPCRGPIVGRAAAQQAKTQGGVPLEILSAKHSPISRVRSVARGFLLDLELDGLKLQDVELHALGRHQIDNLHGALGAFRAFARLERREMDAEALRSAIEGCVFPGRLEMVSEYPTILLDGAHCPASARAACRALAEHFSERPLILVAGLLRDKNLRGFLNEFFRAPLQIKKFITHTLPGPRGLGGRRLAELGLEYFLMGECYNDVAQAMAEAMSYQRLHPETVILSTGSLYSIMEARKQVLRGI